MATVTLVTRHALGYDIEADVGGARRRFVFGPKGALQSESEYVESCLSSVGSLCSSGSPQPTRLTEYEGRTV